MIPYPTPSDADGVFFLFQSKPVQGVPLVGVGIPVFLFTDG
jgi:hypothetical protein